MRKTSGDLDDSFEIPAVPASAILARGFGVACSGAAAGLGGGTPPGGSLLITEKNCRMFSRAFEKLSCVLMDVLTLQAEKGMRLFNGYKSAFGPSSIWLLP